jgi:hypothetical protein
LAAGALQRRRVVNLGGGGVQHCSSLQKLADKNEQMMERRVVAAREDGGRLGFQRDPNLGIKREGEAMWRREQVNTEHAPCVTREDGQAGIKRERKRACWTQKRRS